MNYHSHYRISPRQKDSKKSNEFCKHQRTDQNRRRKCQSIVWRIRHQTGGCVCSAHCRNSMERDAETHCRQSGFTARQAPALCSASCRNKMGRDTKRRNGHMIFSHVHEFGRTEHGGKSVLHCDSGASSMRPRHRGGDVVGDNAHEQLPHR